MRESVETVLAACEAAGLELRRAGREWCGPCPHCGGDDRFHVAPGRDGGAVLGCRVCEDFPAIREALGLVDGEPLRGAGEWVRGKWVPTDRRKRPSKRAEGIRGRPTAETRPRAAQGRQTGESRASRSPSDRPPPGSRAPATASRENPARVWHAGAAADGTAAADYLLARLPGWRGDLPLSVRWVPRDAWPWPPVRNPEQGRPPPLPRGAAGAVLYLFTDPESGRGRAVQCEALRANGERLADRWRRCIGSKGGAVFVAGGPAKPDGLVIAEGEVSALALRVLAPGWCVRGAGGTSGMRDPAVALGVDPGLPVRIDGDADPKGRAAAIELTRALRARGQMVRARIPDGDGGADAADRLACGWCDGAGCLRCEPGPAADETTEGGRP